MASSCAVHHTSSTNWEYYELVARIHKNLSRVVSISVTQSGESQRYLAMVSLDNFTDEVLELSIAQLFSVVTFAGWWDSFTEFNDQVASMQEGEVRFLVRP